MHNYTTIEESKHLLELGLDRDSADCSYCLKGTKDGNDYYSFLDWEPVEDDTDIPCWSACSLLEMMPESVISKEKPEDDDDYDEMFFSHTVYDCFLKSHSIIFEGASFKKEFRGTLMEASYKAVCWLLEEGYLKKKE